MSKYAREGFYGNENHFTADDHGRFLYLDAKVKGYALRPKFPLQPYLGLGLSDLGYELERHHIVYDSANIQKFSVSNRFYGILPHAALDVGLQLRVLHFLEIYAEFNARFLINKAPAIWGPDANYLPSVTYGVNWHF